MTYDLEGPSRETDADDDGCLDNFLEDLPDLLDLPDLPDMNLLVPNDLDTYQDVFLKTK